MTDSVYSRGILPKAGVSTFAAARRAGYPDPIPIESPVGAPTTLSGSQPCCHDDTCGEIT